MLQLLSSPVLQTVGGVVLILVLFILVILGTWKKVPNDHAAVIVGMGKPKVVTGGGTVVIPCFSGWTSLRWKPCPCRSASPA